MPRALSKARWTELTSTLEQVAERARQAGASKVVLDSTDQTLILAVAFHDQRKADLCTDAHRASGTFCAKFGAGISVSDYPIDADWIREVACAIANGGWTEQLWRGRHRKVVRSKAEILVNGSSASFDAASGAGLFDGRLVEESVQYVGWESE